MGNVETELDKRGINITHQEWYTSDFGAGSRGSRTTESSSNETIAVSNTRAATFVVICAGFVIFQPFFIQYDDILMSVLRGLAMLTAGVMVWSKRAPLAFLGATVALVFALGSVSSLISSSTLKGVAGLVSLGLALAITAYGEPIFRKAEIKLSPDQSVYGTHPTEWGRGSYESLPSSIWVMASVLRKLVRIPGITIFHGVKSPGSKSIDVEHVVTHGNNVYLIDSWLEYPSEYNWHQNKRGTVISYKGDDGHRHTKMAKAADRYRKLLGDGVNVVPIIAIATGQPVVGPHRWSPRGVGLFNANELLEYIGNDALRSPSTWDDRPDIREKISTTVA